MTPAQLVKQIGQKNNINTNAIPKLMSKNFGNVFQMPILILYIGSLEFVIRDRNLPKKL